nr:hypothetical protein [Tanacetum cinerariifolium]
DQLATCGAGPYVGEKARPALAGRAFPLLCGNGLSARAFSKELFYPAHDGTAGSRAAAGLRLAGVHPEPTPRLATAAHAPAGAGLFRSYGAHYVA